MKQQEVKVRDLLPPTGTFFGAPACEDLDNLTADVALLGIPYDQGVSIRNPTGQRFAPKAIRDQRQGIYLYGGAEQPFGAAFQEGAQGWFDIDTGKWHLKGVTMADCGDVNCLPPNGSSRNFDRMTEVMRRIVDRGALPVVVGGEHTITFPLVRALSRYDPLDIVHFDSHIDFWDSVGGVKICNADPIRRCSELPFVHNITQIGLRGWRMDKWGKEAYDAALAYGNNIITAERFRRMGVSRVVESIPQAKNIYVTIDIDVFDPAVAPAVAGQEPGGLSYLDVKQTLVGISTRGKVVGFDMVCFIPARDPSGTTGRVVINLLLDFLAAIFPPSS